MSCLDSFLSPASLWAQSDPSCLTGHFPQCQELRSTLSKRWEQHYFPTPCLSLQPWLRRKACLSITHAPFITETTLSKDCSCLTSKDCGFLPTCIFGGCLHIMTAQITPVCWHLFYFFFFLQVLKLDTVLLKQNYKHQADGNQPSPLLLSSWWRLIRRNHLWGQTTCSCGSRTSRILFVLSKNKSEAG